MNSRKKLLILILSVMMVFTLMPTTVFAEGDEPSETPELIPETLWAGTEYWSGPLIENADTDLIQIQSITSGNTDVLAVECIGDPLSVWDYLLIPVNPGTAVITVTFTLENVEYTLSGEYTVKEFPVFLSGLAIDGEAISPEAYNNHNYYDVEGYEGTSPNVKFTLAEGWTFYDSYYNRCYADGNFEEGSLGSDLPENGWSLDFPEGCDSLNTFYHFRNDAGDEIQFGIRFTKATEKYVEYIDFKAMPRLRKDVDAGLSYTALTGDKVTLNYSDGTREDYIFDSEDWKMKSETTGETTEESSRIIISYDSENHVDFAAYNNGEIRLRAEDPSASYVAKAIDIEQTKGPLELAKGLHSTTSTDAQGNEYEEYSVPNSIRFGADDKFIVTYENGIGNIINVNYVYTDNTGGFTLAEDNPYYTGYPSDNYFGNYLEINVPDQSVDHFEVGKTYSMSITYHEYGSNFDLTPLVSEDTAYEVKIKEAGPEDVTSISINFTTGNASATIKKDETLQLDVTWEPSYAVVPDDAITWTSMDPSVAAVDENGLVTAVSEGTTQIMVQIGNCVANKTVNVYEEKVLTDETVSLSQTVFPYTGVILYINNYVLYNGTPVPGSNLSTIVTDIDDNPVQQPKYIGDYKVVINGVYGGCSGSATKYYTIKGDLSKSVTNVKVTLDADEYEYTGSPVEPKVLSVTAVGKNGATTTLEEGTDYEVYYSDNDAPGTGQVMITALDNSYYMGTKVIPFNITEADKSDQSITAKISASKVAVGKTATITVTGAEGEVSYKSSDTTIATVSAAGKVTAKKVGTATITVTAAETDQFKAATKTINIKVVPAATSSLKAENLDTGVKITWKKVTGATGYKVYRGSTLVKTITSGSTVTYTDKAANTNGTKYVFKVVAKAGTGDSTLSKSVTTYRVSRPAISSLTNSAAGKMNVKWAKNAKATGYEIMYSTSKSFASGNKTVKITSKATVSKVIGSLTKGKPYYVKIRTYKTVSGTKYYSTWSAVKNVKISK